VRMDSHLYPDYLVPPNYDSLLGKLIVWGETRDKVRGFVLRQGGRRQQASRLLIGGWQPRQQAHASHRHAATLHTNTHTHTHTHIPGANSHTHTQRVTPTPTQTHTICHARRPSRACCVRWMRPSSRAFPPRVSERATPCVVRSHGVDVLTRVREQCQHVLTLLSHACGDALARVREH
jgi:acetyl/propionyl-CoA carboxylase alpha subunit